MIFFTKHGEYFVLETSQTIPAEITKVFSFFETPRNLDLITPDWLNFRMLPPIPIKTFENQEFQYKLTLHKIRLTWKSRIISYDKNVSFSDKQIKGPYAFWEHKHLFEKTGDATLMQDIITYKILPDIFPSILASTVNRLFIQRDLKTIFRYRRKRIIEIFG